MNGSRDTRARIERDAMSLVIKELRRFLKPGASLALDDEWIYRFENLTDLNDRRVRDANIRIDLGS